MAKKLLVLKAFIIFSFFTYAQSLSLSHEGTPLEPFEEVTVYGDVSSFTIDIHLEVTNNSSDTIAVLVKKIENYLVSGSVNTFCWGQCFLPTVYQSPNSIKIAGGQTNENDFEGLYQPEGNNGESSISYVFFDEANPNDSVMVTVFYTTVATGFGEPAKTDYTFSQPYPNPAINYVKFDYNLPVNISAKLKIYSLIGSSVGEIEISNAQGSLNFNTDNLLDGLYFYTLFLGSEKMESGKFMVKH